LTENEKLPGILRFCLNNDLGRFKWFKGWTAWSLCSKMF